MLLLLLQAVQAHRKGGPLCRSQREEGKQGRIPPAWFLPSLLFGLCARAKVIHFKKADGEGRVLVSLASKRKENWLFAKPLITKPNLT